MMSFLKILFGISFIIQLGYYLIIFRKLPFSASKKKSKFSKPVSIIICAKNEADNLSLFLPIIINQEYSKFEIVLVNDHSTDDTLKVMHSFKDKHANIIIVHLDDIHSNGNKKNALTQGIKASNYEHLLLTDADCRANSTNWISEMTSCFSDKKRIVLGYGAYRKIENSWLNKLIRFETLHTAIQYFSYSKIGFTYMGVGRNIAYTKTDFLKVNGFKNHQHIKSGDDDLFINQVANNNNVNCSLKVGSFTISEPETSFKKWLKQKRRHITTATSYKPVHQFLLGLYYVSQVIFLFIGLFLMINSENTALIYILFLVRILLQYLVFGLSAKKLKENDLILFIPFLELFLIVIQMRIFITNLIGKPKEWQ